MQDHAKERRKNTRLSLNLEAELVLSSNITCHGKIRNISFSGIYMPFVNVSEISPGDSGVLKLFLDSQPGKSMITFACEVVRIDESGVGVKFINVDVEGYEKFKNLMLYNSPDPDKLLAELKKNPGLDIFKG